MIDLSFLPLWGVVALLAAAALVIGFTGVRLASFADRLADKTGLGEALVGAVLLGGSTSLSGIVTSVTAAAAGYAELAVSNATGGIAAQTLFLVVADATYRQANLEHAAASLENMTQGVLLLIMLSIPILGAAGPEYAVLGVNPVSVLMVAAYVFGIWQSSRARQLPMWGPRKTLQTRPDVPDNEAVVQESLTHLLLSFLGLALITAVAGYLVAGAGTALAERTGLQQSLVGALVTAIVTSLPELVITLSAVRQGALTLAVAGILGGNAFDVLFIAFSDVAYRGGSIYHAISSRSIFIMALTMLMASVLLLGLVRRERYGPGRIGFESLVVLISYVVGMLWLFIG